MECEGYNGQSYVEPVLAARRVRKFRGGASNLLLAGSAALSRDRSVQQMHLDLVPIQRQNATHHDLPVDSSFMNNMDEISYWIYTKRAPCLMNYDNLEKKNDEAHCSKPKPKSVTPEVPSPKKKKKRKLSLLDDDSVSTEKKNVYFEVTQKQNGPVMSNCKSDTLGSDVDFNIKNSSVREKPKRAKLQNNSRTTLHKKNKVSTSTPKVTNLRRSLRQAQQSLNNNSHLTSSFELFMNGNDLKNNLSPDQQFSKKLKKPSKLLAGGDQMTDNKKTNFLNNKPKNSAIINRQFEDLSDVSGFTANYIRSTKVQSNKTPRKLRCKPNRNLIKESKHASQKNGTMLVCENKAINTGLSKAHVFSCSTDSSQNIINLVTKNKTDKSTKVGKSTSLLKFMETRTKSKSVSNKLLNEKQSKSNLNISFQSKSSTSRYPTRYKNHSADVTADNKEVNQHNKNAEDKRRKTNKNSIEFNNSDRKENPEEKLVYRTRSGRNIGLTLRQQENSVLVLSNSSDEVSSVVSVNVASPPLVEQRDKLRKKKSARHLSKKLINKSERSMRRDSLRDKSGFAACFSDSDDDSEPLKQRKFFRA